MRFAFMLLAASVAVGPGCKKAGDDASARMAAFKDKMCACKDKACIDQVTGEMAKWSADHRGEPTEKVSEAELKKMAVISEDITKCMTQITRDTAAAHAAAPAANGSAADGSAAGSADGAGNDGAAGAGTGGAAAGGGAAGGAAAGGGAPAETMTHRAGNCPSTVLGATTKVAVRGKAVVLTIESNDKDAIAAIRKRTDELLAEKRDPPTGVGHDMKGTHGGSKGLCPVYVPDGAKATAQRQPKGVAVSIRTDKPDELAKEIDGRVARAAEWVKTNVKPGDKGNQGGVGGGKGEDGSNHSGKGDGKGQERKQGDGGGKGTGGGGGAGTGGGGGKGTGGGGEAGKGGGEAGKGSGAGSGGW
jgi:hypothetical protein